MGAVKSADPEMHDAALQLRGIEGRPAHSPRQARQCAHAKPFGHSL
jgi:hypothetical protein